MRAFFAFGQRWLLEHFSLPFNLLATKIEYQFVDMRPKLQEISFKKRYVKDWNSNSFSKTDTDPKFLCGNLIIQQSKRQLNTFR